MQITLEGMSKWTAVRFLSLHQLWETGLPGANLNLRLKLKKKNSKNFEFCLSFKSASE